MTKFTASDGITLSFDDEGEGPPLICLAGLTRSARDFEDFLASWQQRARVIRLDYRGRGWSEHAAPETYTVAHEALDVVALMDHLELAKATILGTSRGGLIAMVLGATAKERLAGVILNDIGPEIDPAGLAAIRDYVGIQPVWKTHAEMAEAFAKTQSAAFGDVPVSRWRMCGERWFDATPDGLSLRYDPRLRDAFLAAEAHPAPDLWPLFDALDCLPLGLIRGENSNILSTETAREMRSRRPDMHFAELASRGHVPFLDEPPALDVITQVFSS